MALWHRDIPPKNGVYRSTPERAFYKSKFNYCELCKLEGHEIFIVELHHILSGLGRTDRAWNFIMLCRRHHDLCTEHIHGEKAIRANLVCWCLKFIKKEISKKKLIELQVWEPVERLFPEMQEIYKAAHAA